MPPHAPGDSGLGVRPPQPFHSGRHLEVLPHRQAGPQRALLGAVPQEPRGCPSAAPCEQHLQRQGHSHIPSKTMCVGDERYFSGVLLLTQGQESRSERVIASSGEKMVENEKADPPHCCGTGSLSQFGLRYQVHERIQGHLFGCPIVVV